MTGEHLLNEIQTFLERFIAYPSPESSVAHTLWIAHAHLVDAFENTPRLAFLSPEPGSGKSRCMELTEALTPRPVLSVNSTVAYVFRKISDEAGLPTLLMDEIDAVFSGGKSDGNEDLRGLLNSGYRKGATAGRAAIRGKEIITEEWPSYCAVALAGLNQLPDTLMTRSIVVHMKRRARGQIVEPYRRRVNQPEAVDLTSSLAVWTEQIRTQVADAWPELPEGIEDRDADIWEPILAIADAAGGHWPITARDAAVLMVAESQKKPATLGIKLLADIRLVMGDADRISTVELLAGLHGMETAPWANIKGEPIDSRFLAKVLGKYDITTNNTFKINGVSVKGYQTHHLFDAFERYLPAPVVTELGNSGNPGNDEAERVANATPAELVPEVPPAPVTCTVLDTCRVCAAPLLAPASKLAGICGKRNTEHDAERIAS
ncbi:DUF3631 domain-containing protein [Cryobacterium lyxosi]|uniref:DUF3631 domain-containing protein n=1 Tax=Cryobacterium lyxosi TaxID=1259228 RepID=A0A4R8ZHJ4_9MICO|nr:DUF3631 domain-containing protein [Cryobacterium lyxosi]